MNKDHQHKPSIIPQEKDGDSYPLCVGLNKQLLRKHLFWRIAASLFPRSYVTERCPRCGQTMLMFHVNTGAVLVCNLCSGRRPGAVVDPVTYEELKITKDYRLLPRKQTKDE